MPKAHLKSTGADDEDPHGYINPVEAKSHVEALDKLMTTIKDEVKKSKYLRTFRHSTIGHEGNPVNPDPQNATSRHKHSFKSHP